MSKAKPLPPQSAIQTALNYDSATGVFTWRACRGHGWNAKWTGRIAGRINDNGYVEISIGGTRYRAHRLAWVYAHGDVLGVDDEIDHRNGRKTENRLDNLRPATKPQNMANSRGWKGRALPKGIFMCRENFQASIFRLGRKRHLGTFPTAEEAAAAYRAAAAQIDGEFARAG